MEINNVDVSRLPADVRKKFKQLQVMYAEKKIRNLAKDDFLSFVKCVWPEFVEGAHHRHIAKKFNDLATGKINRLIVNMPPRHTKSEFASYLLPAWMVGRNPKLKIIHATHTVEQYSNAMQLDLEYDNLVMASMRGRAGQVLGGGYSGGKAQLGVRTTKSTKTVGCSNLKQLIEDDKLLVEDLEIIKELPITMILRPFNFETFATQAYVYASQDLMEAAALPSLFLISWATILILFSSKYILSQKN